MSQRLIPLRRITGAPAELSDEALLAACAHGDRAALGALYDRYVAGVRRFLARVSGTDERDLDDLVQTTFEAVPRAAARFGGGAPARIWLFGIAANMVRHHVRSEIRRKRLEAAAAVMTIREGDAAAEVLARERAARLAASIAELPPKLRVVFVLVYLEGAQGRDAARVLGLREGAVWKRLHEARRWLRERLGGELA